jgi:ATP-dependent Clp protease ATP-binding subunit ClpB
VTAAVTKHLSDVGFDPVYGARPLKRIINEMVVDEVALQIVEGKILPGDIVRVDYKQQKMVIEGVKVN